MNKHTNNRVKVGLLAALLFLTAQGAQASTWTTPTAAPPNGNVDAPLNASTNAQYKAGALAVGQASNPTAGATLDVNGVTSTNGLANFGTAEMLGFVHIGSSACGTGCTGGASAVGSAGSAGTTSAGSMGGASGELEQYFASANPHPSLLGNVLASIGGSFSDLFAPSKAYATTTTSGTASFGSAGTTYTSGTGGSDGGTTSGVSGGAASGGSSTSGAGSSTTTTTTVTTTSGSGTSSTVSYMLQVDGNTRVNGQLDVSGVRVCLQDGTNCPTTPTGSSLGGTINVIPEYNTATSLGNSRLVDDGTNLAIGSNLYVDSNQGGSLELGANNTTANSVTGGTPYIDFHYGSGVAQDYNTRIINDADGQLSFFTGGTKQMSILNNSQSVWVNNAVPLYKGCSTTDHLVYKDNGSGGGCTLLGYLLPPPSTSSTSTGGSSASTSLVVNTTFGGTTSVAGQRQVILSLVYSITSAFASTTFGGSVSTGGLGATWSGGSLSGTGTTNIGYGTLSCGTTYTASFEGFPSGGSGIYATAGTHMSGTGTLSFTVPSC